MSVGGRVKHLLDSHGHSLRKAHEITGICHETIRRIINGWEGPTLIGYIRRIAEGYRAQGYHVDETSLMEGLDPKGDFEWTIRQAPPLNRLEMVVMSVQERVRLALDFLRARYPKVCAPELLTTASGLRKDEFDRWRSRPSDLVTTLALATAVNHLTGISKEWFTDGWLKAEAIEEPFLDRVCRLASRAQGSSRFVSNRIPELLQAVRRNLTS